MYKYKPYVRKYRSCFILGPLFMTLEACGEFILPYINANIIDTGTVNKDIRYILANGGYMALIAVAMMATGVLGAHFAIKGASCLAAGVRRDVFNKIQEFSFSEIDDFSAGSLITRITNDINQVQNFTQSLLRGTFRSPIMLVGALVMSFLLNPSLAVIILIVVPLLGGAIAAIILTAAPRYDRMQRSLDDLNTDIRETITNERIIKSFVREEHEKGKFAGVNSRLVEKSVSALKMMILMQPVSTLAINATTLAVVWFAGKQIMVGKMELGTLTAFITYLSQVLMALNFLANVVLQGTRAAASDKRIAEVLEVSVSLNSDGADPTARMKDGSISFRNVCFRYAKQSPDNVLENINLDFAPGEFVGIIGSTGSGKTTLVSLIPRLYDADSGEIFAGGQNIKNITLFNLREDISVVLQKNTLFSGTIAENLRWGNEDATDEEVRTASHIACADEFIEGFGEGYDTMLGQGGANLSGGQRQRLCIARALLKKPKVLILDDSTSAVDSATEASIRRAFREELPGVTKLIIAQRINSVRDADRIIVLDDGKIVGNAKHDELMETCTEYREIYLSQKDLQEA